MRQRHRDRQKDDSDHETRLILWLPLAALALVLFIACVEVWRSIAKDTDASLTDWLVVIVAAIAGLITFLQWHAMRQAFRLTRDMSHLTLRAWLVIERITLAQIGSMADRVSREIVIQVAVHNVGRLPAVSVKVWLEPDTMPLDVPKPILTVFPEARGPDGVVIAPDRSQTFMFSIGALSVEQVQAMRAGFLHLYVDALASFTDALGSEGRARQQAYYLRSGDSDSFVLERESGEIS